MLIFSGEIRRRSKKPKVFKVLTSQTADRGLTFAVDTPNVDPKLSSNAMT